MQYLEPWKIQIGRFEVKGCGQYTLDDLAGEIHYLSMLTNNEDGSQQFVSEEFIPAIMQLRELVITPLVKQYAKEVWNYEIPEIDVECNAKWIPPGEGLFPHYHPGSCISAIFYPGDSPSGINFFSPLVNAGRGYPKPIRNKFMGTVSISPKAGELYIFPSYLQHSVSYVQEDVRLSLLHEYYLRHDL